MSGDGSEDPAFVKAAGAAAANGAILTAPAGPAPADFDTDYKTVTTALTQVCTPRRRTTRPTSSWPVSAAGKTSAADMNSFIGSYTGKGESGPISFDQYGDIKESTIFAYKVEREARHGQPDADLVTLS